MGRDEVSLVRAAAALDVDQVELSDAEEPHS